MKCSGTSPKITLEPVEKAVKAEEENIIEEIVYETHVVDVQEFQHITDHQYISFDSNQTSQDAHLEDYTKKEMDVFDYIGIEIKNIQEQEEREKQLQLQNESTKEQQQEVLIDDNFYIDSEDIIEDETIDEAEAILVHEDIYFSAKDECAEELEKYVEFISENSFQCRLCPKIYQKRNITIKHLKSEHQIVIHNYVYDNSNRYRKTPQKDLNWKCRFCPKRYTSKRLVQRHENVHGPNGDLLYKCSCCTLYFQSIIEMETHQFCEHEDRLVCKDEHCGKRFDHPEKLVSHTKYAHSSKKSVVKKYNFVCQLCGESSNAHLYIIFLLLKGLDRSKL